MKSTIITNNYGRILLIFFLYVSMNAITSCSMVQSVPAAEYKKGSLSRKERTVRIYPDLVKRIMHVKNKEASSLDFFVFDLEGTLIRHFKMPEGDHKKIEGLDRGAYMYQVFKGDEMNESGKLNIK